MTHQFHGNFFLLQRERAYSALLKLSGHFRRTYYQLLHIYYAMQNKKLVFVSQCRHGLGDLFKTAANAWYNAKCSSSRVSFDWVNSAYADRLTNIFPIMFEETPRHGGVKVAIKENEQGKKVVFRPKKLTYKNARWHRQIPEKDLALFFQSFKVHPDVLQEVEAFKRVHGFSEHTIVGVHIRHGNSELDVSDPATSWWDFSAHERRIPDLNRFLTDEVLSPIDKLELPPDAKLFLCTDSPEVERRMRSLSSLEVISYDKWVPPKGTGAIHKSADLAEEYRVLTDAIVEMEILSQTDILVHGTRLGFNLYPHYRRGKAAFSIQYTVAESNPLLRKLRFQCLKLKKALGSPTQ